MKVNLNRNTDIYVPDGSTVETALSRVTHLAIGSHADDLEIMAVDGIIKCFGQRIPTFCGIVCTDGAGSVLANNYSTTDREQLISIRKQEQKNAAAIGRYSAIIQLGYSSDNVVGQQNALLVSDIKEIVRSTKPKVIYTHNPVDKHRTHLATFYAVLSALRDLRADYYPEKFYGCEAWRDLDWLCDADKIRFNVSEYPHLSQALLGVFDSQISSGKRYDVGTLGRRAANATYDNAYASDLVLSQITGLDLFPLLKNPALEIRDFVIQLIDRFKQEAIFAIEHSIEKKEV